MHYFFKKYKDFIKFQKLCSFFGQMNNTFSKNITFFGHMNSTFAKNITVNISNRKKIFKPSNEPGKFLFKTRGHTF